MLFRSCALTYDVVAELAGHDKIIAVKEASGDMSFTAQISRLMASSLSITNQIFCFLAINEV